MAQSRNTKKLFNYAYGIGASIVILGALFKIQHWTGGSEMLTIGMFVEAAVFFLSAFESIEEDLDWSLVYPELSGGNLRDKDKKQAREAQSLLSQKLDEMLKDAKLDAGLLQSLGDSIQNFKGAAENIAPAVDSIAATNKYSEQLVGGYLSIASGLILFVSIMSSNFYIIVIGVLLFGFGTANFIAVIYRQAIRITDEPINLTVANLVTLGFSGFIFGPALVGYLAEFLSLTFNMYLLSVVWGLNGVALLIMMRRLGYK